MGQAGMVETINILSGRIFDKTKTKQTNKKHQLISQQEQI